MRILHKSCRLISQWLNRNSCGIQRSKECSKALIILFGYMSQNEQQFARECPALISQHVTEALAVNELIIECLALIRGEYIREAWRTATEGANLCVLETLGQSMVPFSLHK